MQHEAWISRDWTDEGMTWVVVARERVAGIVSVGAFLVDAWCLGVKDAYVDELTRGEFDALLDEQLRAEERAVLEPACAKKLIEGAIAYAQSFGFLPHRDFRKARKILNGLDATDCAQTFTFGCDGKPRFVIGPDDDDVRVDRVIAVLTARLGADGFVVEEVEDPDDIDAEDDDLDWKALNMMFQFVESEHCPERSLSGFFVSGFVVAAVLLEPARAPDAWWKELFGGQEPELPDNEAFSPQGILDGFLELWTDIGHRLAAGEYLPGIPPLDQPDHFTAAADFCRGFLRVVDARPAVLQTLQATVPAQAALAVMRRLALPPSATTGVAAVRRDSAPVIGEALRVLQAEIGITGASQT